MVEGVHLESGALENCEDVYESHFPQSFQRLDARGIFLRVAP